MHRPPTHSGPLSGTTRVQTTRVSRYQKGKTSLDFTEARDSERQWLRLGHMQVCTLLQANNHASTITLSFLQAGCTSCHPTNSVKALKAKKLHIHFWYYKFFHYSLLCILNSLYRNSTAQFFGPSHTRVLIVGSFSGIW